MIDLKHPKYRDRTLFFLGILFCLTLAVLWLLQDYIAVMVFSLIFSIVVRPIYRFFRIRLNLGANISSILTILLSFFLLIMPTYIIFAHLFQEILKISNEINVDKAQVVLALKKNVVFINNILHYIPFLGLKITYSNIDKIVQEGSKNLSSYLLDSAFRFGSASIRYVANTFIFLFLTFFLIPSLSNFKKYLLHISPLHNDIDEIYIDRSVALIMSLLKSIFVIALAQGILGGIFLWIAGVPYVLTLTMILVFASLIPFVGTNIVIFPIALYVLLQGQYASAAIILIGQLVFVTNIDNILAAAILSRDTSLHPALMLLAIIGGISAFGFSGVLFGPIIVILFLTSLEIYSKHLLT